jgi:hypothetical protein
MDIIIGCISLISTIGKTSNLIVSFVRRCRAARHDLDNISRELTTVRNILSLLQVDIATTNDQAIPKTLREVIAASIANCGRVLKELNELLERHNGDGVDLAVRWATRGTNDAEKLRSDLTGYRDTLSLALDSIALYVPTRSFKFVIISNVDTKSKRSTRPRKRSGLMLLRLRGIVHRFLQKSTA